MEEFSLLLYGIPSERRWLNPETKTEVNGSVLSSMLGLTLLSYSIPIVSRQHLGHEKTALSPVLLVVKTCMGYEGVRYWTLD